MSSADPIDVGSSNLASGDTLRRGRSSEKRPANTSDPALREDNDVRSEKPQANPEAKPESRKADRKPPETDPTQEQGPKGIKGAFRKHPIAMVVCLGLIVVGVIAGIAWYLHARHYESTDDAFIDGRSVLVSPQVTGSIISVNVTDNQIVKKAICSRPSTHETIKPRSIRPTRKSVKTKRPKKTSKPRSQARKPRSIRPPSR